MAESPPMTSSKPYLIRALGEWIVDNNLTPYILVDATAEGVSVPTQHISEGKIVLNIGPYAVRDLSVTNDVVQFYARFNGISTEINIPITSVLAIYARENGQGMVFAETNGQPVPPPEGPTKPSSPTDEKNKKAEKPSLKLVK